MQITYFSGGNTMKRPASLVAAILFLLMAIAQVCRFFLQVNIVAGSVTVPLWASVIAAVVLVLLALWLFVERSK
jgi:lipopolysaccharide export LptBFGC system permease protein LptF